MPRRPSPRWLLILAAALLFAHAAPATLPAQSADAEASSADDADVRTLLWRWIDGGDVAARSQLLETEVPLEELRAAQLAGRPTTAAAPDPGWETIRVEGPDGAIFEHLLLVPEAAADGSHRPLIVALHGGVSRPTPVDDASLQFLGMTLAQGEADDCFILRPKGTAACIYWETVGADNILRAITQVQQRYRVDPNRIYLGGFSDGASGSYYFSVAAPDRFAGFLPLNGHPSVAQLGDLQIHLRNATNRRMFMIAGGRDQLYPAVVVTPFAEALQSIGADITYTVHEDVGHSPAYMDQEEPNIAAWLDATQRVAYPAELVWETADVARAPGVDWLRIDEIASVGNDHPFPDVNVELAPTRVRVGIGLDREYAGSGVRITSISEGSLAEEMELAEGDVIVGLDGETVETVDDLIGLLGDKSFGDAIALTIQRGDETFDVEGRFPEQVARPALNRGQAYGSARARYADNEFDVRVQSVGRFTLRLSAAMVDLSRPVRVRINGTLVHDEIVTPSTAAFLDLAAATADEARPYAAALTLDVPAGDITADRFGDAE